ncbi:MAG TPA: (Fe-S)-binding protein, partial [Limnochordia bacterium]|nr:(Fe-S)-binding protein [Limnochordia bacterium]
MRVALFVTCLSDTLYPDVARATVRVLSRFGCEVVFPEAQICCGQPMYNSGYHADAKRAAQALVAALEGTDAIVSPSGSCTTMVRNEWAHLFAGDREWAPRAHAIAKRSYEICEFLVDRLGVDALDQPLGR